MRRKRWLRELAWGVASVLLAARGAAAAAQSAGRSLAHRDVARLSSFLVDSAAQVNDSVRDVERTDTPVVLPRATRLVIGVKSAVLAGSANRQTIRETWADRARLAPLGVHVVFLGCEPDWWSIKNATSEQERRHALTNESETFRDLLTHELRCRDSYWTLVDKVKGFFRWAAAAHDPDDDIALDYVMLVDDDVYVDVAALVTLLYTNASTAHPHPRHRFYAGQVQQTQYAKPMVFQRDPSEKNAVPTAAFPMRHKPPFATGAHYVLSFDLAAFLARNVDTLQGVGTLEDVSVAFWLRSLLRVKPTHLVAFDNVRYTLCHTALVAYADLSPLALRRIHANVQRGQPFCSGFSYAQWDKRDMRVPVVPQSLLYGPGRVERPLVYAWDVRWNAAAHVLHIATTVSTAQPTSPHESVLAVYTPAKDAFALFCRYLVELAQTAMPTTAIPRTFCHELRVELARFVASAIDEAPQRAHVLPLAAANLHHGLTSPAVFVQLTRAVSQQRTVIECLFAAAFPDAHVFVLDSGEHAERYPATPPDVVVVAPDDDNAVVPSRRTRLVVISMLDVDEPDWPRRARLAQDSAIVITDSRASSSRHDIYVPAASLSFMHRSTHSPMALLVTKANAAERDAASVLLSCSDRQRAVASAAAQALVAALRTGGASVHEACVHPSPGLDGNASFHLDDDVERFGKFSFVVVVESRRNVPGAVSHRIVSAFLAGAVPVYVGHSPTVRWLFNPRAFIDCDAVASCAARVLRLAASSDALNAVRREPPVVNRTAFAEVFSWHPHVAQSLQEDTPTLGERLKSQLLRV